MRRRYPWWRQWLIAAALVTVSAPQLRADGPPPRELLLFEEATVNAAAKRPQAARSAPSVVTVITADEIRRFGYRTLAEALRSVRGLYTSYDRNYSYLGVRGFLRPTDYNDRILLLVNGHTYNDDIFQQALIGNDFGIDLEAIERIEVIRGPGSALYGGNALFAVINVVTVTGKDRPGLRALAETGSFGRKRGQMSFGHGFQNGADVYISGSVLDLDGHSSLFYPEYNDPPNSDGIARDVDGEQALNLFASGHYGSWTLQGGANHRDKQVPTGAYETAFNDPGTRTIDARAFAELQYEKNVAPDVDVDARAYFDNYEYDGTYIYDDDGGRLTNKDLASSRWYGTEVRGRWGFRDLNLLTVGSEYSYHPDATQENFDRGGEEGFHDERSFGIWGIYVQDELSLPYGVTLVGGARYDNYYRGIDEVNPRAAVIWEPNNDTTIKLLYGRAFRTPNLYELYYESAGSGASQANPDLRPEKISTFELAVEQWLAQRMRAIAAVYHYEISDLVDQAAHMPDALQYANLGSARASGAEVGLDFELTRALRLRGTYSLQEARAAGGQHLSNSPRHNGRFGAQFPLFFGWEGATEIIVVGPRHTLAGRKLETIVLGNLNLFYSTPIPKLGFSAGFYNIFNQDFSDPAGTEHVQDALPQDGFSFPVQVRYGF